MRTILHLIFKSQSLSRSLLVFLVCLVTTSAIGQVSGKVFIDYDANGKQTSSKPNEPGVAGVRVQLFVGNSQNPITVVTDSVGSYLFTISQAPKDSLVRVEFSSFPATYSPTLLGVNSFTNVQFGKAPATNLNLGILSYEDYCQPTVSIRRASTACYVMGDPLKGGSAGEDAAFVFFDYNASGLNGVDDTSMLKLAKAKEIGPTWGATYQINSKRHLMSAIVRRHVGLGPLGTGGLYMINRKNGLAVSSFLDVKTIGINTGPDPHVDPITNLNILPASRTGRSRDSLAFHMAGKVGIGSIQISRYQDSLFLVNLYDRKLYSFRVANPLAPPANTQQAGVQSFTIPHPNCSNGDFAPWAVKMYRNKVYLGVVCTAETSQKVGDLKGAVYKMNVDGSQVQKILEFPLDYLRDPLDGTQGCDTIKKWKPWSKTFPKQCNYPLGAPDPISAFLVNPQPIISDIEFDDDGSMILGMMDRGGLQTGQNQPGIDKNDTLNYYGFMSGDILRAQLNADGTYTMESNGKSGKYTSAGGTGPGVQNAHDKNAGPGGGEFFYDDYWINGQGGIGHSELTNGGLLKVPGIQEVFSSAMDPLHGQYLASGFIVFDTQTGKRNRSYAIYAIQEGALGKSGGVGDLTSICDPAPLEIGNRVWLDINRNGIQEPTEKGIDGLILTLHDAENGGVLVASDTTSNGGQYYFSDRTVPGGLLRTHKYEIRMSMVQPFEGLRILEDTLQLAPFKSNTTVNFNFRDSDANYNSDSTSVGITVMTGNNAENNYNLDIGLMSIFKIIPNDLELQKILVGDCKRQIGDEVVFKLIARNTAKNPLAVSENVYVENILSPNFTYVASSATHGSYNLTTKLWGPLTLKGGESDTLTIRLKINNTAGFEGGTICNIAEIKSMKGANDIDSKPGNGVVSEDDYAIACVSVPIKICEARKDTIIISAPAGYTNYQWFRNGVKITGATNSTLEVGQAGDYSVEVGAQGCPTKNCCPVYIINDCQCPANICVPFVVKQTKSKGKPIK